MAAEHDAARRAGRIATIRHRQLDAATRTLAGTIHAAQTARAVRAEARQAANDVSLSGSATTFRSAAAHRSLLVDRIAEADMAVAAADLEVRRAQQVVSDARTAADIADRLTQRRTDAADLVDRRRAAQADLELVLTSQVDRTVATTTNPGTVTR